MKKKQNKIVKEAEEPVINDVEIGDNFTFKMVKIWVDKNTINQFHVLNPPFGHSRYIRRGKVSTLASLLLNRMHWRAPLILERINGGSEGFRIIDGAHRWYSLEYSFKKLPLGSKTSIYAGVYEFDEGVSEKEKKRIRSKLFTTHNKGTTQTTADFISSRQDEIPMFNRIAGVTKKIPCTIYGATINDKGEKVRDPKFGDTLQFKNIVGGYFSGKRGKNFSGGYSGSAEQFIKDCKGEGSIKTPLSEEDVNEIEYAWNTIALAYELKPQYDFSSKDKFPTALSKTTPVYVLMRLILQNKHKFTQEQIINRLQRDTVKEAIRLHSKIGGRESSKNCHNDLHYRLNKGYEDDPKQMFIPILTKEEQIKEKTMIQEEYKKQDWKETQGKELVTEDIDELTLSAKKDPKWSKHKGKFK